MVHGLWADHLAGLAFAWPVGDLVLRDLSVHRDLRLRGRGNLDAALAVDAAFPGVLPLWAWAALHSVAAFVVVGIGRYGLFEMIMKTFAALKFGIVILLAIQLAPSLGEIALGFVPRIPEGALINVLAIIGGVGGTYSLAAYTYWVRERGWRHSAWIPTMRTDLTLGYALTALFMVSMLIIGAELLFGTGTSISDDEGLLALVDPMQDRFGLLARWAFLIGFWAVATGAMLGAWNGGAHLFATACTIREVPDEEASDYLPKRASSSEDFWPGCRSRP